MCMFDECDGFVTMIAESDPKARIRHRCAECQRWIEPGETFLRLIIAAIKASPRTPLYDRKVNAEAWMLEKETGRESPRIIDGRVQALRKAGRIEHRKATINGAGGWFVVEEQS